jgi:2-polyprenyl-6-methoxyphenol hydroxylase-like FAD-dependent oxidoreductase
MKRLADAKLLNTYESERKDIATQLINFSTKFVKAFVGNVVAQWNRLH